MGHGPALRPLQAPQRRLYHVPEEIKRLMLLSRWKTGVCPSCFDELAEQGRIRYSFEDVPAVSWSDIPAPKARRRR